MCCKNLFFFYLFVIVFVAFFVMHFVAIIVKMLTFYILTYRLKTKGRRGETQYFKEQKKKIYKKK